MSPVRRLAVLAALLTPAALVSAGCTGDASSSPSDTPTTMATDEGTPLADLDTASLVVRRAPFCDLVDPTALARALGEKPTDVSAHRSGQRAHVTKGMTDVVHEYGCTWDAGVSRAEAWVFAPPVTRQRARTLVRITRAGSGCTSVADAPAYGDPSVALTCRTDAGIEVSYRGLFGDAWLTCALIVSGGESRELVDRTGRWCAALARGASSG